METKEMNEKLTKNGYTLTRLSCGGILIDFDFSFQGIRPILDKGLTNDLMAEFIMGREYIEIIKKIKGEADERNRQKSNA